MDWTIDYLKEYGIVSAKLSGVMTWDEHKKFAEEIYPYARKRGAYKILIDFRDMTPSFTILQIDDLPKLLMDLGVGPEFKIAAVHDPSSPKKGEFTFFRNVATLMHLRVQQFAGKDEAMAWLKIETPASPDEREN
ncbi:MAG: STAS/SEC14 domain-containing protein [Sedimentisphaerales bacterium]